MRGRPNSCCFTGHRPAKLPWGMDEEDPRCLALKRCIADAVLSACEEGYTHFICGMAMGCDLYFAEAVLAAKERYPSITLEAAIPCLTQPNSWPEDQRQRYRRLLDACDYETVMQENYTPYCMHRRNKYMVDHASLLIAVHDGLPGGARSTVLYAMQQQLTVVQLPL